MSVDPANNRSTRSQEAASAWTNPYALTNGAALSKPVRQAIGHVPMIQITLLGVRLVTVTDSSPCASGQPGAPQII
jgi:hypothetical protein